MAFQSKRWWSLWIILQIKYKVSYITRTFLENLGIKKQLPTYLHLCAIFLISVCYCSFKWHIRVRSGIAPGAQFHLCKPWCIHFQPWMHVLAESRVLRGWSRTLQGISLQHCLHRQVAHSRMLLKVTFWLKLVAECSCEVPDIFTRSRLYERTARKHTVIILNINNQSYAKL